MLPFKNPFVVGLPCGKLRVLSCFLEAIQKANTMSLLKTVLAAGVVLYRQLRMFSLSQACPAETWGQHTSGI